MSDRLLAHLARVAVEARAVGRPLLAAWREWVDAAADPLTAFAGAAGGPRFFWAQPALRLALSARGAAAVLESRGSGRFRAARDGARALFADLRLASAPDAADAPVEAQPLLLGGFGFADAPSASGPWADIPALRFALPERCTVRIGDQAWRIAAVRVAPDADPALLARSLRADEPVVAPMPAGDGRPPGFAALADRSPDAYRRGVLRALTAIGRGDLEKVVLARACRVARRGGFDAAAALRALRALHAGCTVFGVGDAGHCFVGATPERLVRREGERVLASALAGSAPRGRTPEEDERLARALRESKKEQAEHEVVRTAIADALAPACTRLDAPESPGLLQLDGIQHLHTPIAGRLRADLDTDVLSLAARLHPTPAVGGAPREAARAFLAAHEALERGWYAGGVGWLAGSGDGELAVALRCALLRGGQATLYAGAGIAEGSDPEAELAETRLKLRAALAALVEL